MGRIYISINGNPEEEPRIFALNVRTHSYGWAGQKDFAFIPYFRVVGIENNRPVLEPIKTGSPDEQILLSHLGKDGEVLVSRRLLENDLKKHFGVREEQPTGYL